MRGTVPGMTSPHPLGGLLPAVFQEDDFTMRLTAGLDEVLTAVITTLDCLDSYFDPGTAPADFLSWLAGWVGMTTEQEWPVGRRRELVARAVELFRMRGTVTGLREHIEVVTGGRVVIADNGGVAWSRAPGTPLPGEDTPRMAVRIAMDEASAEQTAALEALVTAAKPAHVMHRVEVTER